MAEADADLPCRFIWHIINLSVPWVRIEATFYNGSPTQTHQWQVTFTPLARQISRWPFSFSLDNFKFGERDDVIVADQLRVCIYVNGNEMERRLEPNYSFSGANRYTYQFLGDLTVPSTVVTHHVTIEVQLSLANQNIVEQADYPASRAEDLEQLSKDLYRLLIDPRYFNLELVSPAPIRYFRVHSYIMHSRWSSFFSVHPVQTIMNNTVAVDISHDILAEILTYVYCGRFNLAPKVLRDVKSMTELFQVIDLYKMHHLHKVFAVDDSRQVRKTIQDLRTNVEHIRVDGPPPDGRSFTWTTYPYTDHEINFQIHFFLNDHVPRFHYSLQSDSLYTLFVHVKLELETRHREDRNRFYIVHGRDYRIDTIDSVPSGIHSFEGDPRPISEFMDGIRRRRAKKNRKIKHFIRCTLYTSNGETGIMIESAGHIGLQDRMDRYKVLSDHMYQMLTTPIEPDFTLSCPVERPANPNSFRLHKGLFVTRFPFWRSVLDNAPLAIPDAVTCSLESEAFRLLIIFIYSGRRLPIPVGYLAEIEDFVKRSGLKYLR